MPAAAGQDAGCLYRTCPVRACERGILSFGQPICRDERILAPHRRWQIYSLFPNGGHPETNYVDLDGQRPDLPSNGTQLNSDSPAC